MSVSCDLSVLRGDRDGVLSGERLVDDICGRSFNFELVDVLLRWLLNRVIHRRGDSGVEDFAEALDPVEPRLLPFEISLFLGLHQCDVSMAYEAVLPGRLVAVQFHQGVLLALLDSPELDELFPPSGLLELAACGPGEDDKRSRGDPEEELSEGDGLIGVFGLEHDERSGSGEGRRSWDATRSANSLVGDRVGNLPESGSTKGEGANDARGLPCILYVQSVSSKSDEIRARRTWIFSASTTSAREVMVAGTGTWMR